METTGRPNLDAVIKKLSPDEMISLCEAVASQAVMGFQIGARVLMDERFPWVADPALPVSLTEIMQGVREMYQVVSPDEKLSERYTAVLEQIRQYHKYRLGVR